MLHQFRAIIQMKLEQLERLRSEDTPRRLMITHSIESYWIPSQKMTKSKLQILKICHNLKRALHATHLLKLLDKMCKYEMDPMSIVEDTERTRFCPQTDRRRDGQGDTSIPPYQLRWSGGYNNVFLSFMGPIYIIPCERVHQEFSFLDSI